MNGVIDQETTDEPRYYVRFASPFVQKRLFNLYLARFVQHRRGEVWPEFPTGNGKIDLLIRYSGRLYDIEVKSYSDDYKYRAALQQAARYGRQLGLAKIALAFIVEAIDEANRAKYEAVYVDPNTGVTVTPVFVETL